MNASSPGKPIATAGESNKLDLPDDDERGFELVVKWLYQGRLEDVANLNDDAKYDYAVACHKLYLLCEKFDMTQLKNIAMDQYRRCLHESHLVPDAEEINEIYRSSPEASAFRTLMIQITARQIMDPEVDRDAGAYRQCFEDNSNFAIGLVNTIREMSGGMLFNDPTVGEDCLYHDHSGTDLCESRRRVKTEGLHGTGTILSTIPFRGHDYGQLPLVAELPTERKTPRKLATPAKPLSKQAATPQARLLPTSRSKGQTQSQTLAATKRLPPTISTAMPEAELQLLSRNLPYRASTVLNGTLFSPDRDPPSYAGRIFIHIPYEGDDFMTPKPTVESPTDVLSSRKKPAFLSFRAAEASQEQTVEADAQQILANASNSPIQAKANGTSAGSSSMPNVRRRRANTGVAMVPNKRDIAAIADSSIQGPTEFVSTNHVGHKLTPNRQNIHRRAHANATVTPSSQPSSATSDEARNSNRGSRVGGIVRRLNGHESSSVDGGESTISSHRRPRKLAVRQKQWPPQSPPRPKTVHDSAVQPFHERLSE